MKQQFVRIFFYEGKKNTVYIILFLLKKEVC
nr:MAG TPA: hypothetical protein [Caudoviricetes sp.]